MNITFKRDKSKKYVCNTCSKQFNWDRHCWWFGSLDKTPEKYFCSDSCKDKDEHNN